MISAGHEIIVLLLVILSCYEATEQCETVMAVVGTQIGDIGLLQSPQGGMDSDITLFPVNFTLESSFIS